MGTRNHPSEVLQCKPCCQGTWLGCCSPTAAGTAGNTQSYCWLPAALFPPSTHNIWRGMQQSSHSDKSPSHGDSREFSHWFQKDLNSTQEKATLNYCPDSASQDRKAEKQLSCRFPSASCCGGHSLLLQRDGAALGKGTQQKQPCPGAQLLLLQLLSSEEQPRL